MTRLRSRSKVGAMKGNVKRSLSLYVSNGLACSLGSCCAPITNDCAGNAITFSVPTLSRNGRALAFHT